MGDLCSGCLCAGRKLVLLHETEYYHIYSQILNEISVYEMSGVEIRLCWECRATLRRMHAFKEQVKRSYVQLMQCTASPAAPRLSVHTLDLPGDTHFVPFPVKKELSVEVIKLEPEPDLDEDVSGAAFADQLSVECEDHDYEPCGDDVFADQSEPEKPKKKVKLKKTEKKIKKKKKKRKKLNKAEDEENVEEEKPQDLEGEEGTQVTPGDGGDIPGDVNTVAELPKAVQRVKWSAGIEPVTLVNEKPKCEECGKMFSSKKTYRYHMNVLHKGNNQYPCPRCGKVYQWKSNLGRHMRTHKAVDAGELYCDLCDKSFASVATYRQHLKISRRHVSESDFTFVCNECDKKFVNKTRLRDHIDWEHLKKIKFRCLLCNKAFKCHTSLYVHTQNVHRDKEKKDNLCHVCGKSYQNAAKLKYHITAMHSGSSPYRCGECGAAFGWYSSLYRHLRELHYKMKVQPKKAKKSKKVPDLLFQPMAPINYPMQPPE